MSAEESIGNREPGPADLVSTKGENSAPWFRRVTLFSLLAGLCPLIPLPFLDDKVLSWVRRRMIREVLSARALEPSEAQIRILDGEDEGRGLRGCMAATILWPLIKVTVYLVKKVIKKVVILLTLKDCVDRFSETLHEGYLLHRAAGRWQEGAPEGARAVRFAIQQACDEVDPRVVHKLVRKFFQGSRWVLLRASRGLAKLARRGREEQRAGGVRGGDPELDLSGEENRLRSLADGLSSSLWQQHAYWQNLEQHFEQALATRLARQGAPQ